MKYLAGTLFISLLVIALISSCDRTSSDRILASTQENTSSVSSSSQSVGDGRIKSNTAIHKIKENKIQAPFIGKRTGTRIFQSHPEDITSENYPEVIESFVFPNAELKDVIKAMSTDMNINIIMDPTIANKKISIISYSPITVAEAYQAFLSALAVHGLTVVPSGSFLKVVSKETALKSNIHVHTKSTPLKTDQFITQIIKLKHISADSLEKKIKPFIDSKSVQSMIFYEPSDIVIISDHGLNIERFQKIITALDIPTKEIMFKVLPIKHAGASDLSNIISNLLSGSMPSSTYSTFGKRGRGRGKYQIKQDGIKIQSLFHDERTNSIIVMGNKKGIQKVENLVAQLDYYKDPALAGGIFVYKVKHGTAKELATTLNAVIGKETSLRGTASVGKRSRLSRSSYRGRRSSTLSALPSARSMQEVDTARSFKDVRVIAESNTNSLLIVSNKYNYETILDILNKVDISRNQVFIKTIIMELNTDKNKDWKIANYFFPKDGKGLARMGYGLSDLSDLTSPSGATLMFPLSLILDKSLTGISAKQMTDINPLFLGKAMPGTAKVFSIPSLSSFVQFLQKNVGANILSTPQVMALDHQEAIVTINESIPVIGTLLQFGSGANSVPGANINYKNVETALKITPHINPDVSSVRLKIEQKIDSIIKEADLPAQVQDAAVSIKKRTIKTHIALKDRETAVLGGLVKESNIKNESKVPLLGDLPFIGWLFKNSKTSRKKSNLIVFITPRIIRSADEHQVILNSKLKERMNFIHRFVGDKDPYEHTTKQMIQNNKEPLHQNKETLHQTGTMPDESVIDSTEGIEYAEEEEESAEEKDTKEVVPSVDESSSLEGNEGDIGTISPPTQLNANEQKINIEQTSPTVTAEDSQKADEISSSTEEDKTGHSEQQENFNNDSDIKDSSGEVEEHILFPSSE